MDKAAMMDDLGKSFRRQTIRYYIKPKRSNHSTLCTKYVVVEKTPFMHSRPDIEDNTNSPDSDALLGCIIRHLSMWLSMRVPNEKTDLAIPHKHSCTQVVPTTVSRHICSTLHATYRAQPGSYQHHMALLCKPHVLADTGTHTPQSISPLLLGQPLPPVQAAPTATQRRCHPTTA